MYHSPIVTLTDFGQGGKRNKCLAKGDNICSHCPILNSLADIGQGKSLYSVTYYFFFFFLIFEYEFYGPFKYISLVLADRQAKMVKTGGAPAEISPDLPSAELAGFLSARDRGLNALR